MIKQVRVDNRLLHGQVAVSWTNHLGADAILLVTDTLLNDPVRVAAVKMARPSGVKVVVKTIEQSVEVIRSGVTDKYTLFIVCETVEGAVRLVKEFGIKALNLGNIPPADGKVRLGPTIYVTEEEKEMLSGLVKDGVDLYMQMVPESGKDRLKL